MDLSLAQTDALIEELCKRSDATIIARFHSQEGDNPGEPSLQVVFDGGLADHALLLKLVNKKFDDGLLEIYVDEESDEFSDE